MIRKTELNTLDYVTREFLFDLKMNRVSARETKVATKEVTKEDLADSVTVRFDLLRQWCLYPKSCFNEIKSVGDQLLETCPDEYKNLAVIFVLNIAIQNNNPKLFQWCQEKGLNESFSIDFHKIPAFKAIIYQRKRARKKEENKKENKEQEILINKYSKVLSALYPLNVDCVYEKGLDYQAVMLHALKQSISCAKLNMAELLLKDPVFKKIWKQQEKDLIELQEKLGEHYWDVVKNFELSLNPWICLHFNFEYWKSTTFKSFQDLFIKEDVPVYKESKVFNLIILHHLLQELLLTKADDETEKHEWKEVLLEGMNYFSNVKNPVGLTQKDLEKYCWFKYSSEVFEKSSLNISQEIKKSILIWDRLIPSNEMINVMAYNDWSEKEWKKWNKVISVVENQFGLKIRPALIKATLNEILTDYHQYGKLSDIEEAIHKIKFLEKNGILKECLMKEDFKQWYVPTIRYTEEVLRKNLKTKSNHSSKEKANEDFLLLSMNQLKTDEKDWGIEESPRSKMLRL